MQDVQGIAEWIKEGLAKFKESFGIGQPKPIQEGTALVEATRLLRYCQLKTLKKGDSGDMVKTLQFLLNTLGYKTYKGEVPDGVFGPLTERAVIEFQKSKGLRPDGIVGKFTAFKIYQEVAERTRTGKLLQTGIARLINRKIYERVQKLKEISPEYVVEEGREAITVAPKEEPVSPKKKLYIGLAIVLGAYLLSRR